MPTFSTVHHLNLTVTDLHRSADWYVEMMGLHRGWEMPDEGGRGQKVVLLHPSEPLRLVLTQHAANDGGAASEFRTGLDHIAFTVADRAELEAWERHFNALGVEHSAIKEGATGWLIVFRDPDHIQLEVYTASKA
jgi:glyoxylase I family protein